MKVFMSWSGARSKAAAELLHDWVKCVIQAARPWISTRGIGRGAVWFNEINNELKDASVGILCITHQNKNAPWILFEAGALAKGLTTNKVCTFLVDLSPPDIQDPLAQFNHTLPTKDGMMSLAATLNSALETPLDSSTLSSVFEAFWPQFEKSFAQLLVQHPQEVVVEARSEASMLEEILESTRTLAHRVRSIEERQMMTSARSVGLSVFGYEPTITQEPANEATRISISRGVDMIREFEKQGLTYAQAYDQMSKLAGRQRAAAMFDKAAAYYRSPNSNNDSDAES